MRIIATVPVYNEVDIIGQVLEHLSMQGVDFVVLDGGSHDGSAEIARGFAGKGLLELKILKRNHFQLKENLDVLLKMAIRYRPDWIIRNDADEFFEGPVAGQSLGEAIAKRDQFGSNLVQFDNFEFCLTEKDCDSAEVDIRKKLRFYTWSDDFRYKAWKYYAGTEDRESGGHYPIFPRGVKAKLSDTKFVLRHYRFRSPEQALRKVFRDRLPRFSPEERSSKLWHVQYDHFKTAPARFFVLNSDELACVDGKWDTTPRYSWYPGDHFHSREEILLLSKIQERTGLLGIGFTWSLLHQVKLLKSRMFPANANRGEVLEMLVQVANHAIH